jgi:hypothetical protein
MLNYIGAYVNNGLPETIEINSLKTIITEGAYSYNYFWGKNHRIGDVVVFVVMIKFELLMHGVPYGFFSVENMFEAKTVSNELLAYDAIKASVTTINKELSGLFDIIFGANSYNIAPFICPDYESLANDITVRIFKK